jgi:predicted Zn-dependent peptidase
VLEHARAVFSGEGVSAVGNYGRFTRNVTAEQVKRVAEMYLDPKLLRVVVVRGQGK